MGVGAKEGAALDEPEKLTLGGLRKAVVEGDVVEAFIMADQIAGPAKKEQTCAESIQEIMEQAEALMR